MLISPCRKSGTDQIEPSFFSKREQGFSLIEVIVTLAIISVVISVISVSLSSSLKSARFSALSSAAAAEVRNFRAKALLLGQSAVIMTDTSTRPPAIINNVWRFPLPEGWSVEGDAIEITAAGMCLGGDLLMISPEGRRAHYAFTPPKCAPKRIAAPAGDTGEL